MGEDLLWEGLAEQVCFKPGMEERESNNNNNNTQLLPCHMSTDTIKTVGVESQAQRE